MINLSNNYSYKYFNNNKIFCITINNNINGIKSRSIHNSYYSVPYKSQDNKINSNVLIGFNNKEICIQKVTELNNSDLNYNNIELKEIDLIDMKYLGTLMNLPIVIILDEINILDNQKCIGTDYEIHYIR